MPCCGRGSPWRRVVRNPLTVKGLVEMAARSPRQTACGAPWTHLRSEPIHDTFQGDTVREGVVEVFALKGYPNTGAGLRLEPRDGRGRASIRGCRRCGPNQEPAGCRAGIHRGGRAEERMMRALLLAALCLVAACSFLSPGNSGGRECRSYCNDLVTECVRECDQDRTCQAACKSAVLDPCLNDCLDVQFRVDARQPD